MTAVLSVVNLKGGVGKTALSVNFAAWCARRKLRTLLVDLDPQTNATFSCLTVPDWKAHAEKNGTVADLLGMKSHSSADGKKRDAKRVLRKGVLGGVDLIPSHLDLFTVDLDLAGAVGREKRLGKSLQPILDKYDVVVCDCPPNLTIPTQNALAFSTHYVVPISPDFLSSLGVGILLNRIGDLSNDLDNTPKHIGIVISRVGRPARHRELTVNALKQTFPGLVFDESLAERVAVSEAAESQRSIFAHNDPTAAAEFAAVSKKIHSSLGIP